MAVDGRLNFDTKIDTKGFSKGVSSLSGQLTSLKNTVVKLGAAIGVAFSVSQIVAFGKASVTAANQTSNAWQGLQSIMDGQGRSFSNAKSWIQDYVSDGLIPLQNAVTAYKNLASRGYDDSQIQQVLTALKDSSAYGRQASYSMGEAVQTATEGLKNENSILVDNAGVTKNVAKMWDDYAKSIGTTSANLTQQQKIQAEVNGIMTETRFQTGDAAKVANSFSGQLSRLAFNFNELKVAVGSLLKVVLQPVVVYLNTALTNITALAKTAANVLGITTDVVSSGEALSDGTSDAASNYEDMAAAAEEAANANENSLASFDKINKLGDSKSSSAAGTVSSSGSLSGGKITVAAEVDTSAAEKKLANFFNGVKKSFSELFKPLKSAWSTHGKSVTDSVKNAFDNILSLLSEIGDSFKTVWTNGTGEKIVGNILEIFKNIFTTIGNIADNLKTAWTTDNLGTDIVQHAADIFDTILRHVENITRKISDWAGTIDFEPLLSSFDTLLQALEPFADNVGEGLEWFFDNVLLPLASWTIEDLIPAFLSTLRDVISGLNSVWETAEPVLQRLWDSFLQPLASWAADTALSVLQGIGSAFKTLCENVTEKDVENMIKLAGAIGAIILVSKGKQAIDNIGKSFEGLKGSVSKGITSLSQPATMSLNTVALAIQAAIAGWTIGSWIYDSFGDEIDSVMYPIYDAFVAGWNAISTFFTETVPDFFSGLWESIKETMYSFFDWCVGLFDSIVGFFSDIWEGIKNVFAAVGEWFKNLFTKAWEGIKNAWSAVVDFFAGIWDGICNVFSSVASWFSGVFTTAWDNIKSAFSAVSEFFGSVWEAVKKPFASVADWFKNIFTKAWEGVKNVFSKGGEIFSGIKEGISETFFAVVNGLIDGINWVIAKPFEAINAAIGWIRDIEILDWQPFSGLSEISIPQIPKLATGTVVPANYGEFLAVLGDNKRETEIVSPLSTIKQAVREAMSENRSGSKQPAIIYVMLDGTVVAKSVIDNINDMTNSTGSCPINI